MQPIIKRTITIVTQTTWTICWPPGTLSSPNPNDENLQEALTSVTNLRRVTMKTSDELKEMTIRCLNAFTADVSYLTGHISPQDGVLAIGTDPQEWWSGHDTITEIFKAQSEAMQGMAVVGIEPEAYSEGSVGWAAASPIFQLPDGTELPFRLTVVYHQEDGEWKVVQWHASLGVANEEAIGEELPT
jgi:hypothetical protein